MPSPSPNTLEFFIEGLLNLGVIDISQAANEYLNKVDRIKLASEIAELDAIKSEQTELTGKEKKQWQGDKSRRIGYQFEKVIQVLFENSQVFDVKTNVRSLVAELDVVFSLKTPAGKVPFLAGRTHLLGEAKCYECAPKSEWITELLGLLQTHGTDVAFIFVYHKPKKLDRELRQAIGIGVGGSKFVVPFGIAQFTTVRDGRPVLEVMNRQYIDCATHSSELSV